MVIKLINEALDMLIYKSIISHFNFVSLTKYFKIFMNFLNILLIILIKFLMIFFKSQIFDFVIWIIAHEIINFSNSKSFSEPIFKYVDSNSNYKCIFQNLKANSWKKKIIFLGVEPNNIFTPQTLSLIFPSFPGYHSQEWFSHIYF